MPHGCHGLPEADVYEADEYSLLGNPSRSAYGTALAISLGLHLLILGFAARYLFDSGNTPAPAKPRTIHLTLSSAQSPESDAGTHQREQSAAGKAEAGTPKDDSAGNTTDTRSATGQASPLKRTPGGVTASRIRETAKAYARSMAADDTSQTPHRKSAITSTLERAFNPQAEPPGVSTRADGTIRVVTPFGTTYCIKPRDDSRIQGPEDDLPVSMICR